jgi:hypothetical protein
MLDLEVDFGQTACHPLKFFHFEMFWPFIGHCLMWHRSKLHATCYGFLQLFSLLWNKI